VDGGNSELAYRKAKSGQSAYFGQTARNYEQDRVTEPIWQIEQNFVSKYISGIPRGNSILDIPVGTGRFIGLYQQAGLMAHCVDISLDMIAEVRTKFGLAIPGSSLSVANAMALPFSDLSFDYLICWRLFHLTPRRLMNRVVKELARVTRRELVFQFFSVALETRNPITRSLTHVARSVLFPLVCAKKALMRRNQALPWLHIRSFMHYEQDILASFEASNLRLLHSTTIDYYDSRPVRVYILAKRDI
jgi:ubiquinone/menaquinone biosynthesis C-methylase UbiE